MVQDFFSDTVFFLCCWLKSRQPCDYNSTAFNLSHGPVFKLVLKKWSLGMHSFAAVRHHSFVHVLHWWPKSAEAVFSRRPANCEGLKQLQLGWSDCVVNRITHPYPDKRKVVSWTLVVTYWCLWSTCPSKEHAFPAIIMTIRAGITLRKDEIQLQSTWMCRHSSIKNGRH